MKKPIEEYFLWRLLVGLERFILVATGVCAVLAVVLSVLMRYVFKTDLYGVEEIIIILAMWLYFIGGAYGSYKDCHIKADVLSVYVTSPRLKRALGIFVALVAVVCCAVLVKWSWVYLAFTMKIKAKTVSLRLPLIISQLPICLCFFLSLLYSVFHLVNAILGREPLIIGGKGGDTC